MSDTLPTTHPGGEPEADIVARLAHVEAMRREAPKSAHWLPWLLEVEALALRRRLAYVRGETR